MIRITLPFHLRNLANVAGEVTLDINNSSKPVTLGDALDALEARYPTLRGTIRDHATKQRRAFLRYFACNQDLSLEPLDTPLPDAVQSGGEPLMIIGAIAGG